MLTIEKTKKLTKDLTPYVVTLGLVIAIVISIKAFKHRNK